MLITMGDVAGIGPEIIVRRVAGTYSKLANATVVGDPDGSIARNDWSGSRSPLLISPSSAISAAFASAKSAPRPAGPPYEFLTDAIRRTWPAKPTPS